MERDRNRAFALHVDPGERGLGPVRGGGDCRLIGLRGIVDDHRPIQPSFEPVLTDERESGDRESITQKGDRSTADNPDTAIRTHQPVQQLHDPGNRYCVVRVIHDLRECAVEVHEDRGVRGVVANCVDRGTNVAHQGAPCWWTTSVGPVIRFR